MSPDAPYGERRNPSTRFLPPDPRVSAPYRLTPGLALRVGVLGVVALAVFAVLFVRLWSLQVLSGAKYLSEAQNNQLRDDQDRGSPRADSRPQREGDRGEHPGHCGEIVGRRHAQEARALPDDQAPRSRARRADGPARSRSGRPAASTRSRRSRSRPRSTTTRSTTCRSMHPSSPASRSSRRTCATTRTSRSVPRSSGTSVRSHLPS